MRGACIDMKPDSLYLSLSLSWLYALPSPLPDRITLSSLADRSPADARGLKI